MKRWLALVLCLVLMLCCAQAFAAESLKMSYDGQTYSLTLQGVEIANGMLRVKVLGVRESDDFDGLELRPPFLVYAVIDGKEYEPSLVLPNPSGVITFAFDVEKMPDQVYIYPEYERDGAQLLYSKDAPEAVLPEPTAQPTPVPTPVASLAPVPVPVEDGINEIVLRDEAPEVEATEPEADEYESIESGEEEVIVSVLRELNDEGYSALYDHLADGNTVAKGAKGDIGKSMQRLMVELGQDIAVDGQVGKKSIAALNAVQQGLGLAQSDELKQGDAEQMLMAALMMRGEEVESSLLSDRLQRNDYNYLVASCYVLKEQYYNAHGIFESIDTTDAQRRAEACILSFPKDGEIYRNKAYGGTKTHLTFKVDELTEGSASLFKLYKDNGDLVSCVFLKGTGKTKVKIPSGTYTVKMGVGSTWYGLGDAFGAEGYYETMLFDGSEDSVALKSGYEYVITINTSESGGSGIGSQNETWGGF